MTARALAGLGAVLAVFALALPGAFGDIGGAMEEGFMLVLPERVLAGDVPNRDFLFLYGPGSLWSLAAAFAIAEPSIEVERVVGALQLLALTVGVWWAVRPWGEVMAAVAGVTAAVFALTPIGLVALPWMGGLALLVWGANALAAGRPLLGGVLLGLALLYRPDLALAAALVLVLAGFGRAQAGMPASARPKRVLVGIAIGASPMLVHVAIAGWGNALRGMFVEPVFRLRPGRTLPLLPSSGTLDGYLQRIAELDVIDFPAPVTVPVQIRLWALTVIAATVVVAVAAYRARRRGRTDLVVLAAIAVGILPQALQRPDSTHLAWVSCFTLAVLPVAVAELLPGVQHRKPIGIALLALAALVAFPAFAARPYVELVLQTFGERRTAVEVDHGGRRFLVGRADVARAIDALAPLVDRASKPGDRLFVGPADLTRTPYVDSWLYHLFPDLEPATRYIEMDPGIADRDDSGMATDLASADVVVLTETWDDWVEPNDSVEHGGRRAARVLRDRFCEAGSRAGVTVLVRCDR